MTKRHWLLISLTYLVIIALIGTFMRLKFVFPIQLFNYTYILHSHSHVAILGWAFSAFIIAILYGFLGNEAFMLKRYVYAFWLTQISVIGMLITFAIQGYAAFSIVFSSLHIFISYFFIVIFLIDNKRTLINAHIHNSSLLYIYGSLLFLFLSSFGPWSLGFLATRNLTNSDLFKDAIYFYLHFQYNGWFTFALLGVMIWSMEQLKIRFNKKKIKFAFWLTFIATFPAFLLSVSYDTLPDYATNIAFAAGIIQLIGIVIYFTEFLPFLDDLTIDKNFTQRMLLYVSSISLLLKFVLQAASGLNKTNHIVFINRDIVIGYIHLVTLGFVTCGLLFWLLSQRLIRIKSGFEIFGIHSFVTGFVITEILLFIQVLNELLDLSKIPYRLILFIFSAVMLLGLITFWIAQFSHKDLRER